MNFFFHGNYFCDHYVIHFIFAITMIYIYFCDYNDTHVIFAITMMHILYLRSQ